MKLLINFLLLKCIFSSKIMSTIYLGLNCNDNNIIEKNTYTYNNCLLIDSDSSDETEIDTLFISKLNDTHINVKEYNTTDCKSQPLENYNIEFDKCYQEIIYSYKVEEIQDESSSIKLNYYKYLLLLYLIIIFF